MRSTFKVLFFLKRDKQKTNGMIPLFCRITVDGQEARFGMKCDVNPKFWDVKTGRATGRTAEAAKANTLVDNTQAALYKVYREMQERDNYVTAEKVKNAFLGFEQKQQTLLELFDSHNEERKLQIGVTLQKGTYRTYQACRRVIADFISYKFNVTDIPIKEVNRQFISDFELFLLTKQNFSKNYITGLMKKFRHIIEVALNKEWIYRNPFKEHKLQWQKSDRGFLTQSEIETLMYYRFDNERMGKTRDIFIFCAFTGLSYTDVKHLTNENIQTSIDGNFWIKGKRKKTDIEYNIPLLNIPKAILEKYKYKEKAPGEMVLPVLNNYHYNINLKDVAKQCGIEKKMTSHLARHTFATFTLTKGVSIESVSKMLGHTKISTTQIYARITDNKIGSEMNVFARNVKKMEAKLQNVKEVNLIEVLKSLKISSGKASDKIWETLTTKVWLKMANFERQSFVSEVESKENKPKTIRDFHIVLMDYFLENLNTENIYHTETKLAVNF